MSRMDEYLMAIITGENEDLPEPRSSTEREFYEAAKRGLGGVELPFGETTVMSDTLTWDGNTEGLVGIDFMGSGVPTHFHVTDTTPTLEELQQGGTIGTPYGLESFGSEAINEAMENIYMIISNDVPLVIIALEETVMPDAPLTIKKGVYFFFSDGMGVSSFTINNYTGFETTEVKTIDPKYLPRRTIFYCQGIEESTETSGEKTIYKDEALTQEATPQEIYEAYAAGNVVVADPTEDGYSTGLRGFYHPLMFGYAPKGVAGAYSVAKIQIQNTSGINCTCMAYGQ